MPPTYPARTPAEPNVFMPRIHFAGIQTIFIEARGFAIRRQENSPRLHEKRQKLGPEPREHATPGWFLGIACPERPALALTLV